MQAEHMPQKELPVNADPIDLTGDLTYNSAQLVVLHDTKSRDSSVLGAETDNTAYSWLSDFVSGDSQELADLYTKGEEQTVRRVEAISKLPVELNSEGSLLMHGKAIEILEATYGDALHWRDQGVIESPVAEYIGNKMLPVLYFGNRYRNYDVGNVRHLSGEPKDTIRAPKESMEALTRLEVALRQAVTYALELGDNSDPLRQVTAEYLEGDKESFGLDVIKEEHLVTTRKYRESTSAYLYNICTLGREGVAAIHEATGIVNFDRYNTEQLELALRFAIGDPEIVSKLNEEGAQWHVSGVSGDSNRAIAEVGAMPTTHMIPFEVRSTPGRGFDAVQDAFDQRNITNITHGVLALHGVPGSFILDKDGVMSVTDTDDPRSEKIADSVELRKLLHGLRPDGDGYRNMTLLMCNSAVGSPIAGSVADAIASTLPKMRVTAGDGNMGLDSENPMQMKIFPLNESGYGMKVSTLYQLPPTVVTSGVESYKLHVVEAPIWASSTFPSFPTYRQEKSDEDPDYDVINVPYRKKVAA